VDSEKLSELLLDEIKDLYSAEKQLVKALQKIARACDSDSLASVIRNHLTETENQVGRLEKIFAALEERPRVKHCKGMEGLIAEGSEAIEEEDKGPIRDLMIIGAAQRVEHYEMALRNGSLCSGASARLLRRYAASGHASRTDGKGREEGRRDSQSGCHRGLLF
jgi:ferritin-like metal-binding protein YciE